MRISQATKKNKKKKTKKKKEEISYEKTLARLINENVKGETASRLIAQNNAIRTMSKRE